MYRPSQLEPEVNTVRGKAMRIDLRTWNPNEEADELKHKTLEPKVGIFVLGALGKVRKPPKTAVCHSARVPFFEMQGATWGLRLSFNGQNTGPRHGSD